jgi:RNA polymerase sigma-70 factor (ECF subfamily)
VYGPVARHRRTAEEAAPPAGVEALKRHDAEAWTSLFEEAYPLVFRAALATVGERTAAEDVAAQVFADAIAGIGRYRDRGYPILTWLLKITRNRCVDRFRAQQRELPATIEPSVAGPESSLASALSLLAHLTYDQRIVVHLRFVEGMPIDEVARLTHRTPGAVKSLQHRALGRLRTILEEEG